MAKITLPAHPTTPNHTSSLWVLMQLAVNQRQYIQITRKFEVVSQDFWASGTMMSYPFPSGQAFNFPP